MSYDDVSISSDNETLPRDRVDEEEEETDEDDEPSKTNTGPKRNTTPSTTNFLEDSGTESDDHSGKKKAKRPRTVTVTRPDPAISSDPYSDAELALFRKRSDLVACLSTPWNPKDMAQMTEKKLLELLKALEGIWCLDKATGLKDIQKLSRMTIRNLGFDEDNMDTVLPEEVERRADSLGYYRVQKIQMFLSKLNLAYTDQEKNDAYRKRCVRLLDIMYHCSELLYGANRAIHLIMGKPQAAYSENVFRFKPMEDFENKSNSTNFVIFVLGELHKKQYRKFGTDAYGPIFTKNGTFTNAWKKIQSIEEFVRGCVIMEVQGRQFDMVTSAFGMMKETTKFVTGFKSNMFPDLEPNRYLLAFNNGIYYTMKDAFLPYEDFKTGLTGEFEIGEDRFDNRYVCCNYFDMEFKEFTQQELYKQNPGLEDDDATPEQLEELLCCGIPTPIFQSLLEGQGFDADTITWVYGLLGRALYWGGDRDEWQVCMFLMGYGGTGKSTILKLLRQIYRLENIGILSNNVERQWALASIWDKYVVLGYEVKQDFKWEQGEFQSCISMEEVSVMVKREMAFAHRFMAHIFLAGNEMVTNWRDNSGSLARRLIVLNFARHIPKDMVRPHLLKELQAELPNFIQKINKFYIYLTKKYGGSSIHSHLPPQMKQMQEEAMESMNPLINFMRNGNMFAVGPERFCKLDDFVKLFNRFCDSQNYRKMKFNREFYRSPFAELGYYVVSDTRIYDGQEMTCQWIQGMDILPFARENMSIQDLPQKIKAMASDSVYWNEVAKRKASGDAQPPAKKQKLYS